MTPFHNLRLVHELPVNSKQCEKNITFSNYHGEWLQVRKLVSCWRGPHEKEQHFLLESNKCVSSHGCRERRRSSHNWANIYTSRCMASSDQRDSERQISVENTENETELTYSPSRIVIPASVPITFADIDPEPWRDIWGRNLFCAKCCELVSIGRNRLVCWYRNQVIVF
jgi:hypothetical protein